MDLQSESEAQGDVDLELDSFSKMKIIDDPGSVSQGGISDDPGEKSLAESEKDQESCVPQYDKKGGLEFVTIQASRNVIDTMTECIAEEEGEEEESVYLVSNRVVKLCVDLIDKFTPHSDSPDEFLHRELKEYTFWNDYDLYICIEFFFECLDHADSMKGIIQWFLDETNLDYIREREYKEMRMAELGVLAYIVFFESQRILSGNMVSILMDFNTIPGKDFIRFLLDQCHPESKMREKLCGFYDEKLVDESLLPNYYHSGRSFFEVLDRYEFLRPRRVPPEPKVYDFVPFPHRPFDDLQARYRERAREKMERETSYYEFKAAPIPVTTYVGSDVEPKITSEYIRNQAKANALLKEVRNLKKVSRVYDETRKSERYFHIMNKIRKEQETVMHPWTYPKNRFEVQKVLQEPSYRGKWNTTAILRQMVAMRQSHELEHQGLAKILEGTAPVIDYEKIEKEERQDAEAQMCQRWGRMLDAKLAYQRAIAAKKDVAEEKRQLADIVRYERESIQDEIAFTKRVEYHKGRMAIRAARYCEFGIRTKVAVEENKRAKQEKVRELKEIDAARKERAKLEQRQLRNTQAIRVEKMRADKAWAVRKQQHEMNPFRIHKYGKMSESSDIEVHLRRLMNQRQDSINMSILKGKIQEQKSQKAFSLQCAIEDINWFRAQKEFSKK